MVFLRAAAQSRTSLVRSPAFQQGGRFSLAVAKGNSNPASTNFGSIRALATTTSSTSSSGGSNNGADERFGAGVAMAALLSAAIPIAMSSSSEPVTAVCQEGSKKELPINPFWPSGVDPKQVDALVEDCLGDPSINIRAIPDFLERQVYKSTIQLTLNFVYQALGQLHGTTILAHELELKRTVQKNKSNEKHLSQLRHDLDEEILDQIASRMLANKAINQSLIPDALEQELYRNCLKIIFRVLDLLSASFCISVCGHDFALSIEPSKDRHTVLEQLAQDAATGDAPPHKMSSTPVNTELLMEYAAQQAGIDIHEAEMKRSWYQRMMNPLEGGELFMTQLHASLYSLLLGIFDNVLEHTELDLLNETVHFDIRPLSEQERLARTMATTNVKKEAPSKRAYTPPSRPSSGGGGGGNEVALASFTMGVGVGFTLMAAVVALQKRS